MPGELAQEKAVGRGGCQGGVRIPRNKGAGGRGDSPWGLLPERGKPGSLHPPGLRVARVARRRRQGFRRRVSSFPSGCAGHPHALRAPLQLGSHWLETIGDRDPEPQSVPAVPRRPRRPKISPNGGLGRGGRPFPPARRDPAPQGRLAVRTAGITFHPVHDLTRRPFAHRFHDQSHGHGVGSARGAELGAQTQNELSSLSRPQVGSLAGRCLAGRAARRRRLLCIESRGCNVSQETAGSSGGRGDGEGKAPGSRLRAGSARSPLRWRLQPWLGHSARVSVPSGLQFMACTAEGRAAKARRCRRTPEANLPVRLVRGSEAPGTTSYPAEMTRGLLPPKISLRSPRVRGARATSPPPARCRAVPPPGPTAGARCACACAPARGPIPGSACQSGRCGRLPASRSRPAGSPGTEADLERVRGGSGGGGGFGSLGQSVC